MILSFLFGISPWMPADRTDGHGLRDYGSSRTGSLSGEQ
jgi:hypothetical protein